MTISPATVPTAVSRPVEVGLNAVILAVTDEEPRVLTFRSAESGARGPLDALPFGPLDAARDRTLELALRRWVREQTGLSLGYVEQLYTFGDRDRVPRADLRAGGASGAVGARVLSIGYLSLVREAVAVAEEGTRWRAWYGYLPWEDWRQGRPAVLDRLLPGLDAWCRDVPTAASRERRERVAIAYGVDGSPWDGDRVLDRYELLYEAGLVPETGFDRGAAEAVESAGRLGRAMAYDHRRILATALGRIRAKIRYRPVVFELVPETFTLLRLQRVVEALSGVRLHKQNFRRLVDRGGLVEGTGRLTAATGGRPAELFRFRREVKRERPSLGVGLPSLPRS